MKKILVVIVNFLFVLTFTLALKNCINTSKMLLCWVIEQGTQ